MATATGGATLAREARHCVAVVTRNEGFPAEAVDAAAYLRVIGVHGTGTDPVAVREATQAGIAVVNTPGTNARSVAEHAVALMLALAKMLPAADRATRAGNFGFKYSSRLIELHGRTLGLIGFGNIGQITARLAVGFGMRMFAYDATRPATRCCCCRRGARVARGAPSPIWKREPLSFLTVPWRQRCSTRPSSASSSAQSPRQSPQW